MTHQWESPLTKALAVLALIESQRLRCTGYASLAAFVGTRRVWRHVSKGAEGDADIGVAALGVALFVTSSMLGGFAVSADKDGSAFEKAAMVAVAFAALYLESQFAWTLRWNHDAAA